MPRPLDRRLTTRDAVRSDLAYVVAPAGRARATIVVLHAWWGLTEVITGVCDDLAELGYVAVAPYFYGGEIASTPWKKLPRCVPRKALHADVAPDHRRGRTGQGGTRGGGGRSDRILDGWTLGVVVSEAISPGDSTDLGDHEVRRYPRR